MKQHFSVSACSNRHKPLVWVITIRKSVQRRWQTSCPACLTFCLTGNAKWSRTSLSPFVSAFEISAPKPWAVLFQVNLAALTALTLSLTLSTPYKACHGSKAPQFTQNVHPPCHSRAYCPRSYSASVSERRHYCSSTVCSFYCLFGRIILIRHRSATYTSEIDIRYNGCISSGQKLAVDFDKRVSSSPSTLTSSQCSSYCIRYVLLIQNFRLLFNSLSTDGDAAGLRVTHLGELGRDDLQVFNAGDLGLSISIR